MPADMLSGRFRAVRVLSMHCAVHGIIFVFTSFLSFRSFSLYVGLLCYTAHVAFLRMGKAVLQPQTHSSWKSVLCAGAQYQVQRCKDAATSVVSGGAPCD